MAITKGHPAVAISEAVAAGLRDVGENRVHEALAKFGDAAETLARPGVRRHMVGHLQRNKARDAVRLFDWVQSVDSPRLARALSGRCEEAATSVRVLVEVNASGEEQKHGLDADAAVEAALAVAELPGLELRGLMAMAPWTDDESVLRSTFARVRRLFERLQGAAGAGARVDTLSMGMSNDYRYAVEEGATMVRLGTALLGPRS